MYSNHSGCCLFYCLSDLPVGVADECHQDPNCPYKVHLDRDACWGYESACPPGEAYSQPSCPGDARGWVNTKKEQRETFYKQADFGYVKKRRSELAVYCQPEQEVDSSLECSDHLRFCRGKNLWLDLRHLTKRSDPVLYHTDVLMKGQIGGHCRVDEELLKKNTDMISFLQSWGPEMRHFQRIDKPVARQSEQCDIWVEKPAYVMKLDAIGNMYHHFCDFFNLYASLHVNNSDERAFFNDTQVLVWTTYQYRTNFAPAFTAFTENPIWNLKDVSGKRVCFREVMFPLLPRMIFGLYYNTPLIWGCEESGLFHAFSRHMLHRLGVFGREGIVDDRIHITILSRQTKYRQILNEGELTQALQKNENYVVHRAVYSHQVDLQYQLRQDQWTDIFVGMHGSGLTHLLFLPDWAVVFEIYNCGDPNCYQDLARLRGIKYMTWEDSSKFTPQDEGYHPQLKGAHEKFTNYTFDVAEFQRLIEKAVKYVKGHQGWQNLQAKTQSTPGHQEL
ncbi:hypothetical protein Pmani_020654 [Petrolisthes manimaculis]|uniref:EGF domain-specific O-linked N-acetylglucosamine transferase n=1 Tax=Petrolisthes manimaculis TaxID=1843537 RepID=A0AAE1PI14_9EUCA|nr:hypothetical protein Pmani_020654 [Petrolisthes manimaculis]